MEYNTDNLKTKSKDELIQIAKELLKEKFPEITLNLNDFFIQVWITNYGITNVIFRRSIRYVSNEAESINTDITMNADTKEVSPFDSDYISHEDKEKIHYDITINLNTKKITPFDNQVMRFYTPSKNADKAIAELKENGFLPKANLPDIEYTITENAEYYLISCFDNLYHIDKGSIHNKEEPYLSKTIVDKKTGKIIFYKASNPFYYLHQITFDHYYQENLYTVLKDENISDKNNQILKIAADILKDKQPTLKLNPDDFEIIILGNYKDIMVKYRRFIRFYTGDETPVFDLAINIITKEIFPFNAPDLAFHISSPSENKAINLIRSKIPLEQSANMEHSISENEGYFFIASLSKGSLKKYFINKNTNQIIWIDESNNLQINNREDLSLQEHYKRMNGFFGIRSETNQALIDMALAILKEKQFIPNINIDEYSIKYEASKNEVKINFTRLVKFIPLRHKEKSYLEYDLQVNLVAKTVAQDPAQFYFPTTEDSITIELVKTKLIEHFKGDEKTRYPLEIVEEKNFFTIQTADAYNYKDSQNTKYRMDKKTNTIEVVTTTSYLCPSPAMPPMRPREIKK